MSRLADDPNSLAAVITSFGGEVIPGPVFRFDLPLEKIKEVVPKINQLGIGVFKVDEKMRDHPTRLNSLQSVATLGLYRQPEKSNDTSLESIIISRRGW
jgi:hypothetical protein